MSVFWRGCIGYLNQLEHRSVLQRFLQGASGWGSNLVHLSRDCRIRTPDLFQIQNYLLGRAIDCNFLVHSQTRVAPSGIQARSGETDDVLWILQSFHCCSPTWLWIVASCALLCRQTKAKRSHQSTMGISENSTVWGCSAFHQCRRNEVWPLFF